MPSLWARQDPFSSARNTFSSWDTCMAKVYCKWPVIVGIIIGSLILISVVTCIARCICCGAECACCCFRCCTCCCSGGGRSGHKRMKSNTATTYPAPYATQPLYGAPPPQANPYAQAHAVAPRPSADLRPVNQQYRSNAMPVFGNAPERPQFATFDSTRAVVNEDALPAMPTWKDGRNVHVEVEQEVVPEKRGDVEMNRLNHEGRSPVTHDTGFPPGYYPSHNDSFGSAVPPRMSPVPQRGPYAPQDGYRKASPGAAISPVHAAEETYRHEPQRDQSQQYGRQSPGQHHQAHSTYDEQDYHSQHDRNDYSRDRNDYTHDPYTPSQPSRYTSPAPPPPPQYIDYSGPAPPPKQQNQHQAQYQNPQHHQSQPQSQPQPQPQQTPHPSSLTHAYPPSESTLFEPPSPSASPAYPGQRAYNASPVPQAQAAAYVAFQPGR